jgi:hypothetical protein
MKSGKCPKCNSTEIRVRQRGIEGRGGGLMITFSPPGSLASYGDAPRLDFYVCTACGYVEQYIGDAQVLARIAESWGRVG